MKAVGIFLVFIFVALFTGVCLGVVLAVTKINLPIPTLYFVSPGLEFVPICLVVARVYKLGFIKAAKAVLPYEAVLFSMLLFDLVVVRPFVYDAFYVPTNGMAPTLLGEHWETPCPRCGKPAYGTPLDLLHHAPSDQRGFPKEGVQMVCSNELTSVFVKGVVSQFGRAYASAD